MVIPAGGGSSAQIWDGRGQEGLPDAVPSRLQSPRTGRNTVREVCRVGRGDEKGFGWWALSMRWGRAGGGGGHGVRQGSAWGQRPNLEGLVGLAEKCGRVKKHSKTDAQTPRPGGQDGGGQRRGGCRGRFGGNRLAGQTVERTHNDHLLTRQTGPRGKPPRNSHRP